MSLRRWSGLLTATALVAAAWLTVALMAPPTLPHDAPADTEFSAGRAWRHIDAVAAAPRPVGTAHHARTRAHVLAQLRALGLEMDTLTAVEQARRGGTVRSALTRNLVARLPGDASTGAVMLLTHYDGVPLSPAAGDDGMGVAAALEVARALRAGRPLRNDVIFLFTDAEELGLLGARTVAASHPWMADVGFVVNLEARGTSGAAVMFETGRSSDWAVRELARVGRRPVSSSIIPAAYARMPNDTDFSVFRDLGLPGLNFAIGGTAQWYHTPGDTPENLSPSSLQHMGHNALAVVRRVGAMDLDSVAEGRGGAAGVRGDGRRIYFHVPGLGLVGYHGGWALPLAALLVVALVGAGVLAWRRDRLTWWGVPVGLVVAGVALVASALLAHWLWTAVGAEHPEWGALPGRAIHREWPYALAAVALTVAVVTAPFALLRRWVSLDALTLGALLLPVAGAVVTAVVFPAGSYLLLWPAWAAVAMVALGTGTATGTATGPGTATGTGRGDEARTLGTAGRGGIAGAAMLAALGVATLVVILIMVPVLYMIHVMLGMAVAALLALVAGVMVLTLLPVLDHLSPPHRAWLPVGALLAAAALVALGLAGAARSPERPAPSNVVHVQDGATETARWASPLGHDDAFTAGFLAGPVDTARLGDYSAALQAGIYRVAPAPAWPAPPMRVRVVEDADDGQVRRVRVRLSWDDPPMMVEVRPVGDAVRLVEPAGPAMGSEAGPARSFPAGRWRLERWGLGWPLDVAVETSSGEAVGLRVSARYPGLPPLDDGTRPARPADAMAAPMYRWFPTLSDVRVVREAVAF
jgi:hypothetical protein